MLGRGADKGVRQTPLGAQLRAPGFGGQETVGPLLHEQGVFLLRGDDPAQTITNFEQQHVQRSRLRLCQAPQT
jgi:hypothetical protein